MPGIYGYVRENSNTCALNDMTNCLLFQENLVKSDDFCEDSFCASHIHLGKMQRNTDTFFKDGIYVSIEGEQYDFKDIPFEELLFNAYKEGTLERLLNKLDGYFCAVIYDSSTKKVFYISDRYGMRMSYYYFKDGRFAFSGEVKGLLAIDFVDKSIDRNQIECFMNLGYLLEDTTWHTHIKLLNPATIVTFDISTKELTQKRYWKWSDIKQQQLPFNDAVSKLGKLFIKAVDKRFDINQKVGVALSGGLDSRAIFAAVNHLYPDFKGYSYTFGTPHCEDIEIAKQCVSHTQWDHEEFHFNTSNWFKPRINNVWISDGMFSLMHMHGCEFVDNVNKQIDFNLNGYAGDVVMGGGWFNRVPLNQRATSKMLQKFYKQYGTASCINDDFYDTPHAEPHLFMNRARRFTNMGTVNELHKLDQRKPFFDNDIIELIYSLPDNYRKNSKLYTAMLLQFFPMLFKDIPWQRTGKPISNYFSHRFLAKVVRKIKSILSNIFFIKEKGAYTDYPNWIRTPEISDHLLALLDKETAYYSNYTDEDYKQIFVIPHLKKKKNYSEEILRAATIELYLNKISKYLR